MDKLRKFAKLSATLGVRKGESAKSLRQRDKAAADKLAQFIRENDAELTRNMTLVIATL